MDAKAVTAIFLVSDSISMIMATPYWIGGIANQYTKFEIIQIQSAYCEYKNVYYDFDGTNADSWEINFLIKNAGMKEVTITKVFVNGRPISNYGSGETTDWIVTFAGSVSGSPIDFENGGKITIDPGSTKKNHRTHCGRHRRRLHLHTPRRQHRSQITNRSRRRIPEDANPALI